jgi:hypothetical protein
MPSYSKPIVVLLGSIGAAVLVGGGFLVAEVVDDANDPVERVGAVDVGDVRGTPGSTVAGASEVLALDELTGTVERRTDDGGDDDEYRIGSVELDLGPETWIRTAQATEDYDSDGSIEPLRDELRGLEGQTARLLVRFDDDRDEADVYLIGDLTYRDPSAVLAPWQEPATGELPTRAELEVAAASAVGAGARVVDLEPDDGTSGWEAEVVDANGAEHRVLLGVDGQVLDVRRDD